jgi:hypothetical protein
MMASCRLEAAPSGIDAPSARSFATALTVAT